MEEINLASISINNEYKQSEEFICPICKTC